MNVNATDVPVGWHLHKQRDDWWQVRQVRHGGTCSLNFKSREAAEAKLAEMAANGACVECGDVLHADYVEPTRTQILERQLCFMCLFWSGYVAAKDEPAHVVANGWHYVISPDQPKGFRGFEGFGGAAFTVQFHDGREVATRNLWTQGEIPEHFRERLPDNATLSRASMGGVR